MHTDPGEFGLLAMKSIQQPVLVASATGELLYRNPAAEELLPAGTQVAEALVTSSPESTSLVRGFFSGDPIRPGGSNAMLREVSLRLSDSRVMLANVELIWEKTAAQVPVVVVMVEDVSESASAAGRLAIYERLNGAGRCGAEVAHELNSPLDGVMRYLGLAEKADGEKRGGYLRSARQGLERIGQIIRSYSSHGRSGAALPSEPIELLLRDAVGVMKPRADRLGVRVMLDIEAAGAGRADGRAFQVFCNILRNALDVMPDGGELAVCMTEEDEGVCVIEFADTGPGIDPQDRERIFLPFYSTKPDGRGSGLGLAICREILARLDGVISASPRDEGGAVITVCLPVERVTAVSATE